ATATLDNGADVDFYCYDGVSVPLDCLSRPYTGDYANGKQCPDSWVEDQKLQLQKMVNYVARKSGPSHARSVIAGDFWVGPAVPKELTKGGQRDIAALLPDNYQILSSAFGLSTPAGFKPECTLCTDNPMTTAPGAQPTGSDVWTRFIFQQNIPVSQVRSTEI